MSLEEDLLKQLVIDMGEVKRTLGDHGRAIVSAAAAASLAATASAFAMENLRTELIGTSIFPGRLGKIELEVENLKDSSARIQGATLVLHYIITVGSSIAAFFGLHKFWK